MHATGSVPWVVAQASVLGRCGGSTPYPSSSASAQKRGGGGSGRFQVVGVVRCSAQEKKPRVRKTKEERRKMVESFVNTYRISNDGKFPSVNLTHKEVGGSYYIVREIVRDIIQENKILGPGGLNAKTLSFEDCPDSLELSIRQELDQDNIEILGTSDEKQVDMDSVLEVSNSEEVFSLQKNVISIQQLLGSSHLLESSVLNSVVQNGNLADTACLETNLEKEDEVPCGRSIDIDMNSSDRQAPSFVHVSDSDKEIELESLGDGHEGTSSSITDEVILSSESSAVFQTNEALLQDHVTSPNDHHDDITSGAVDEAKVSSETNGVHQMNQTILQQDEMLPESVTSDDVPVIDGQFSSTVDAFNSNTSYPETEGTAKFVEVSGAQRAQDEFEQSMLDASPDEQEKSGGLVSHPELDTKGLLHMKDKFSAVEEDESEFNKSISTITKEELEASGAKHGDGISTRTAISRRTGKAQHKKETNLFWLIIRAFVVAMSKFWTK